MVATMRYLDRKAGDKTITWDKGKPEQVDDAQTTFDSLTRVHGYLAYTKEGENRVQIHDFDPQAEEIILVPQMQGG